MKIKLTQNARVFFDSLSHSYLLDGEVIYSTPLTAGEGVAAHRVKKNLFQKIKELFVYG